MPQLNSRPPRLCRHRQTSQACVYFDGRRILLGYRHGSPEARLAYDQWVQQWFAGGRKLPPPSAAALDAPPQATVAIVVDRFLQHAEATYPKREVSNLRITLRHLVRLHADLPAAHFGPNKLRAWREQLIDACDYHTLAGELRHKAAWSRPYLNKQTSRIKQIFRWAAAHELVDVAVYNALRVVEPLRRGRTKARETLPVKPVRQELLAAVLDHLPAQVRAIVELEAITGARGGELLIMRLCDLDMQKGQDKSVWIFRPSKHKNDWRDDGGAEQAREIYLGKRCQEIIAPFLTLNAQAYLFSPADAERQRREKLRERRRTPTHHGNRPGSNRAENPLRRPGDRYTPDSYRRAIARACELAFPPPADLARGRVAFRPGKKRMRWETSQEWERRLGPPAWEKLLAWRKAHRFHPHQLRHSVATRIQDQYGIEAARVILGHKNLATTQIYAEQNRRVGKAIMADIG